MASTTPFHDLTAAIRQLCDQIDAHADTVQLGTFTVPVEEPPSEPDGPPWGPGGKPDEPRAEQLPAETESGQPLSTDLPAE